MAIVLRGAHRAHYAAVQVIGEQAYRTSRSAGSPLCPSRPACAQPEQPRALPDQLPAASDLMEDTASKPSTRVRPGHLLRGRAVPF